VPSPLLEPARSAAAAADAPVLEAPVLEAARSGSEPADGDAPGLPEFEPGLADLEAAVGLVSAGLATRVVLAGFQSWPGLLWRAYQLADTTGVLILPSVVRPGGKVDIVVTRDTAANG
jgi:hypothetical protein